MTGTYRSLVTIDDFTNGEIEALFSPQKKLPKNRALSPVIMLKNLNKATMTGEI